MAKISEGADAANKFVGKWLFCGARYPIDGPTLLLEHPDNRFRCELPIIGASITIQRLKRRRCIGRYSLATSIHEACPHQNSVDETRSRCPDCEQAIGFAPAFYNLAPDQISYQQKQYNNLPHVVYLAWFGPGIIKAGISSSERCLNRWLEQGASAATIVFRAPDAYAARRVEAALSGELGFREIIRAPEKFRSLFPTPDFDRARAELFEAKWQIVQNLAIKVEDGETFICTSRYFESSYPSKEPIDLSTARPLSISGRGYGAIGDFLLVEQAERYFLVKMKTLLAHIVSISAALVPNASSAHVQSRML